MLQIYRGKLMELLQKAEKVKLLADQQNTQIQRPSSAADAPLSAQLAKSRAYAFQVFDQAGRLHKSQRLDDSFTQYQKAIELLV